MSGPPSSKSDRGVIAAFSGFSKRLRQSIGQMMARAIHLATLPKQPNKMMTTRTTCRGSFINLHLTMAFCPKQGALGQRKFLINSTSLKNSEKVEALIQEKTRFADLSWL